MSESRNSASVPEADAPTPDDDAAARRRILDAAHAAFGEHGYERASMRTIAREAGLRAPAHLYVHFPSKEELYREVIAELAEPVREVAISDAALSRSPERALATIARTYLRLYDDPQVVRATRLWLSEAMTNPERASETIEATGLPVVRLVEGYLDWQVKKGTLYTPDVRATALWFVWQLLSWVQLREFLPSLHARLPDLDDYVEMVVDHVVFGLRRRPDGSPLPRD